MANITVTVSTTAQPVYVPNQDVTQGDTVSFQLASGSPDCDVYFEHPSLLEGASDDPLYVGSQGASMTVSERAPKGPIRFSVGPHGQGPSLAKRRFGGELESANGELDVTTEPPTPPKEK